MSNAKRTNPFPGLRPFEQDETHLFFGREAQTDELLKRLREHRFLAVVGTSGSGKSSLVKAGLLPALFGGFMTKAGAAWRVAVMRPGAQPIASLAQALMSPGVFAPVGDEDPRISSMVTDAVLRAGDRGLIEVASDARMQPDEILLVVVDQFEELFRFQQTASEESAAANETGGFVKLLLQATLQNHVPIYVVITMRSDFLGDCARFRDLPETMNECQYLIPRMTREELQQAIEGPVRVGGGCISPELVNRLLNDVGDNPDHLPVLQHALMRTWDFWIQRGSEGPIDLSGYKEIGEMEHALSRHADEIFSSLPGESGKAIARSLFKNLTDLRSDSRGVRRPSRFSEICAVAGADSTAVSQVVEEFRSPGRTFLTPPVGVELLPDTILDISHESLMRIWDSCRKWAEEEAKNARVYTRLAEQAALFQRDEASLYRDQELDIALDWKEKFRPNEAWAKRYDTGFQQAMEFLDRSVERREKELADQEALRQAELDRSQREIERQRQVILIKEQSLADLRTSRLFLSAGLVAALCGMGASIYLYSKAQQSEIRAMITSSTRLASMNHQADAVLELIKAGSMAQHSSWIIGPQLTNNVRLQLARGLSSLREINTFEDDLVNAYESDFTNDGKLMAVASRKGIRLFDIGGSPFGQMMKNEKGGMISVDSNSSGGRLASIDSLGSLQIWNVKTQEPLLAMPINVNGYVVRFSPNGSFVATGGDDGKVRFFADNGDSTGIKILSVSNKPLYSIDFSHDGSLLATAGSDGFIRLWNVKTGARIHVIPVKDYKDEDQQTRIYSVSFRPDSKTFVTGSLDGAVRLWDTTSGKLLATGKPADDSTINQGGDQNTNDTSGHKGTVLSVAFNRSGDLIASGSIDGTFQLWRQKNKELMQEQEFSAYGKRVWDVRFSPDGKRLAASTAGGKIRIVDWQGDEYLHRRGHKSPITGLGFSPNGKLLASVSEDMNLRLWNLGEAGARPMDPILLRTGGKPRLSIKPDGMQIATGQQDGSIQLWTSSGEKVGTPLTGHKGQVLDVQFHPNGPTLASAGEDGTVLLWDLKTRKPQQLLSPQPGKNEEPFNAIAFNPDGSIIAAARNDGSLIVVPVNGKSKPQKVLTSDSDSLSHLQFSPDGKSLYALGDKGFIQRWQVGSWEFRDQIGLEDSPSHINGFVVSPDSQAIITANVNGSVTLWRPNGEKISMLEGVDGSGFSPLSVALARDHSKIAFAGMSGDITFWELKLDSLVDRSCELLSDYLSTHPLILKEVEPCQSPERLNRAAEALVREGDRQVKQKDGLRALQNFQLAKRWSRSKSIHPEVRVAPILVYSGIRIAELTGDVASTAKQLNNAHDIDPKLNLMPRDKMPDYVTIDIVETDPYKAAVYWATLSFLTKVENDNSFKAAKYLENIYPSFKSIVKLHPKLFRASDWNAICWFGSIKGLQELVKPACDLAVRMASPEDIFLASDTRGLNAALRGDISRAISDFRSYMGDTSIESKYREKRAEWVRLLKGGVSQKTIFTPQVLENLKDE